MRCDTSAVSLVFLFVSFYLHTGLCKDKSKGQKLMALIAVSRDVEMITDLMQSFD